MLQRLSHVASAGGRHVVATRTGWVEGLLASNFPVIWDDAKS
jgi:hypothetical protein